MNDLASDLNEFNDFYNNEGSQIKEIERPQNPFHKNFQSYQSQHKHQFFNPVKFDLGSVPSLQIHQRNSLSPLDRHNMEFSDTMVEIPGMKKYQSIQD